MTKNAVNNPFQSNLRIPSEIVLTRMAIFLTFVASFLLAQEILNIFMESFHEGDYLKATEEIIFSFIVFFFIYGNLVYQFTRTGYLKRFLKHRPDTRAELECIYDKSAPKLTLLIPSYKEETRIIKEALLSAALQEYTNRRVVLLIDDPPNPSNPDDLLGLSAARRLPHDIQKILEKPRSKLQAELADFIGRKAKGIIISEEYSKLASLYHEVASWFAEQASNFNIVDHTDRWFVNKILLEPAQKHFQRGNELLEFVKREDFPTDENMILREYRKLASLFDTELTSFERKRFINLSHESNKAMNLNSYIGLIGKSFHEVQKDGQLYLEQAGTSAPNFSIPDTDYLITLDADSLLVPEYALRLIHVMEQPGNEKFAVVQTPYNAIPNPPGVVERIAGATTDIQYIIHQGFTYYQATFWVGANALLRKAALDDICITAEERGFRITRYIQDRTVIEDTESSVDLIDQGWKLFNYPDHLSYSATPPDFGSLLIQRRRWANGGLIILPKLLRYLFRDIRVHRRVSEGLNRIHYLASLAGVNTGLLLILLYPFETDMRSVAYLSLLFFINFFIYGRDLVHSGYKFSDLFRIYALNLMLVPINLGGVFKSLHQAWTGQKIPFKRTPKVRGRTSAPAFYIMAEFALLLLGFTSFFVNAILGRWLYAAFAAVNTVFFLYIVTKYIGLKESKEDLLGWWPTSHLQWVGKFAKSYAVFLWIVVDLIVILVDIYVSRRALMF